MGEPVSGCRLLLALCALGLLCACSSTGIITSLDDLTAHTDQDGIVDVEQQRILSLSGLIPRAPLGALYRYDGDRSPFTAIRMSTTPQAKGTDATATYLHRVTIENDLSLDELVTIRDELMKVRRIAAELIRYRVRRAGLDADDDERDELDDDIDDAQQRFDDAQASVTTKLKKPGLMVVRAETSHSGSLGARLGAVLGLSQDTSETKAGFALLAGLRTTYLVVGSDLADHFDHVSHDWALIGKNFPFLLGVQWRDVSWLPFKFPLVTIGQFTRNHFYIVTSRLEAEHVLYAQDSLVERKIQADLQATLDELSNAELLAAEQLEIDVVLSAVESLGSVGILGNAEQEIIPFRFADLLDRERFEAMLNAKTSAEYEAANKEANKKGETRVGVWPTWNTVYAVMTEVDDLDSLVSGNVRLHFSDFF